MANEFSINGANIQGDIIRRDRSQVPQASPLEFLSFIDTLLALPGVTAVGWTQYTPYFNDGDPCEFSVGEISLQLDPEVFGEVEDDDTWGLEGDNWISSYGLKQMIDRSLPYPQKYQDSNYRWEINGIDTKPYAEAMKGWDAGSFEAVAAENFGDHATVTATRDGFSVDYLEHD